MQTNKYEIAANLVLAGLEGFKGVLTANVQRQVFGKNIFGRKTITIDCDGQGKVYGSYSCSFGTDSSFFSKTFEEIAAITNGQRINQF